MIYGNLAPHPTEETPKTAAPLATSGARQDLAANAFFQSSKDLSDHAAAFRFLVHDRARMLGRRPVRR